jgi:hypothetical protein
MSFKKDVAQQWGWVCKRRTCSRPRHMDRRGDPMSRARSRLVMHTNYDGCTFASVQYCPVLGTYEHTDWRHFRKDRNRCLAECCQRRSQVHQHRQQTPSNDVRFDTQKSRSGSEGTLGEVVDGTTVQSGVTIAQFLKGFFGRSANRDIGSFDLWGRHQ